MSSQIPNNNITKYSSAIQGLLAFANAIELSEITAEHLDQFCAVAQATAHQRSRMFGLWSGSHDPSPELEGIVAEIAATR